jgi:hypothetical protein
MLATHTVLIANTVGLSHGVAELPVVVAQLGQHVTRRDVICVVIQNSLQALDVAGRMQCSVAELTHAFGDRIGRSEDLVGLLVEQKVIVPKVRA